MLREVEDRIGQALHKRRDDGLEVVGPIPPYPTLNCVPTSAGLPDARNLTQSQQMNALQTLPDALDLRSVGDEVVPYIASIESRRFNATHQAVKADEAEKQAAVDASDRLRALVKSLLGTELGSTLNGELTLFELPLSQAGLSEGQRILLQLVAILHAKEGRLDERVLLLDEPENHLHPRALVTFVHALQTIIKNGQIWIATHSVPLLASLPTQSIWFVNEGKAKWAGRTPELVVQGLLGGATGREDLEQFLALPAQLAANRFAAECLVPPRPVDTDSDDPQAAQVRDRVAQHRGPDAGKLNVLDYGAGQGRVLESLIDIQQDGERVPRVDYYAFEPAPPPGLAERIHAAFPGDSSERLFETDSALRTLDAGTLDVVIMCNVLHEISPDDWTRLFGAHGIVTHLLRPSGAMLVLEDMEMPHGERAHKYGFLILDRPQLLCLFDAISDGEKMESHTVREGRLQVHVVPAPLIARTTPDTVTKSLELLREAALERILAIRSRAPSSRNGRLHALWTHLHANAQLALLGQTKRIPPPR